MSWKASRVHGITTVTQLPLGAAEQIPYPSQHLQYKQSRLQCCSQPSHAIIWCVSSAGGLWCSLGYNGHLWRDHRTVMSIWTGVGRRMHSCCMRAATGEGYTPSSWHCADTLDSNFNGNTVISKIFSPPVFIAYNSRTGSEAGEFHCSHILNG